MNADRADVHFTFESSDERVPAHRIILSSISDVFDTMFYGILKEDGDIKIVDATAVAFKEFLRCFYFNKVDDVSSDHVPDIMYLSMKYNVPDILQKCALLLKSKITNQTVIHTFGLAIFHDLQELQRSCESFIAANLYEVLRSESFLNCDRRILERVLKMDFLPCSETELFEVCMSWVRVASETEHLTRDVVQTQLGNLFYEIRFGAMTSEEFGKLLPVYGELFSANEHDEIARVISGQETDPQIFKASRRIPVWDSTRIIRFNRFLHWMENGNYRVNAEYVTEFSTNTWLLLGHFTVAPMFRNFGRTQIKNIPNVEVTITTDLTKILTQFTCTFDSAFVDEGYNVNLPTPMYIQPERNYEIWITLPASEQRFLRMHVRPIVVVQLDVRDVLVNFRNDQQVNGQFVGLIKSLGFNWTDISEISSE